MSSEDSVNDLKLLFNIGETLIVELKSGQVLKAEYRGGSDNKINLINVSELITGNNIPGFFICRKSEIGNVKVLSDCALKKPDTIGLIKSEFDRLDDMCKNSVYMATADDRFIKATDHLLNCENVGVVAVGSELGRNHKIVLLIMCSWERAYIFDVFLFQQTKFIRELKEILSSKHIKKIVHDSRTLVDCLHHQHNIELNNVFDTAVANIIISRRKGDKTCNIQNLSQCLERYLNFPSSLIKDELDVTKWRQRPLSTPQKIEYVRRAVYLITLKNCLENKLLGEYQATLHKYYAKTT